MQNDLINDFPPKFHVSCEPEHFAIIEIPKQSKANQSSFHFVWPVHSCHTLGENAMLRKKLLTLQNILRKFVLFSALEYTSMVFTPKKKEFKKKKSTTLFRHPASLHTFYEP